MKIPIGFFKKSQTAANGPNEKICGNVKNRQKSKQGIELNVISSPPSRTF
jgi:hypothetical protein